MTKNARSAAEKQISTGTNIAVLNIAYLLFFVVRDGATPSYLLFIFVMFVCALASYNRFFWLWMLATPFIALYLFALFSSAPNEPTRLAVVVVNAVLFASATIAFVVQRRALTGSDEPVDLG